MKMVRVDGHRLCLIRTSEGVFAHRPRLPARGIRPDAGRPRRRPAHVRVAQLEVPRRPTARACSARRTCAPTRRPSPTDGAISVTVSRPDPAVLRPQLIESMRRGIANDYIGQVSRDVVRLLQNRRQPGRADLGGRRVRCATGRIRVGARDRIGARTASRCCTCTTATSAPCRSCRASPASPKTERGRPVNPLPRPAATVAAEPAR